VLEFAAALSLAAILGKQVCAFGILEKGLNRIAVGVGMIPRGEVGLIFAGIGATLMVNGEPIFSSDTFSAMIVMVMVTTLATPPLLKAVFSK
jgi:Kef-type K+ transport system membrane component KefB